MFGQSWLIRKATEYLGQEVFGMDKDSARGLGIGVSLLTAAVTLDHVGAGAIALEEGGNQFVEEAGSEVAESASDTGLNTFIPSTDQANLQGSGFTPDVSNSVGFGIDYETAA